MAEEESGALRVLALGAHPDDIEAGCGGTLIKYARAGHKVFLMVLTEGEQGAPSGIRRGEQEEAGTLLSAEKIYWGPYRDTEVPLGRELIHQIEQVLTDVNPHVIFVHYHDDTHQDHRHLSTATVTASRYTKNVLFFEGPTTQAFSPTVFVDIELVMEEKVAALMAHASQVKKTNIEDMTIVDITRSTAHFRGIQCRVKNAEGFVPLRLLMDTVGLP